jgi:uncharacterized protein YcfJ
MDPRIEEILMARAIKDASEVPTAQEATLAGSVPGAIAGAALGQVPHSILHNTTGRLLNRNSALRPGARMAGSLVGAVLGGGLGMGTRQMMMDNSPAATLLARAQADGGLSASDQKLLGSILEDTYQQMGLR